MKIESMAYALPPLVYTTASLLAPLPLPFQRNLNHATGIESIRKADPETYSLDLAREAVAKCFVVSSYAPEAIDAVICCNICRVDAWNKIAILPSSAAQITAQFKLQPRLTFDVNNACAGVFTGLYLAQNLIKTGQIRNALIVSGERISVLADTIHRICEMNPNELKDEMMSCLSLGDSGLALLVDAAPEGSGFTPIELETHGLDARLCMAALTPYGPIMHTKSLPLISKGASLSGLHTAHYVQQYRQPVDWLILHQVSKKAIQYLRQHIHNRLETPLFNDENTFYNVQYRGNTSSTSHFIATLDGIYQKKIRSNQRLLYSISASGITTGSALYQLDDLPTRILDPPPKMPKTRSLTTDVSVFSPIFIASYTCFIPNKAQQDSVEMGYEVARHVLKDAPQQSVGLVIFTGVFRTQFLSEPAVAALILQKLQQDEVLQTHLATPVFAFDLIDGAVGTQTALSILPNLLKMKHLSHALVINSEATLPLREGVGALDLPPTASAFLVSASATPLICLNSETFYFGNDLSTYQISGGYLPALQGIYHHLDPNLDRYILDSIQNALDVFLFRHPIDLASFDGIVPPVWRAAFHTQFRNRFKNISDEKIIVLPCQSIVHTTSLAWVLRHLQSIKASKPRKVLVIQITAGLQVNLSIWQLDKGA